MAFFIWGTIYEHFMNSLKMNGYSFILTQNSTFFDLSIVLYFNQKREEVKIHVIINDIQA